MINNYYCVAGHTFLVSAQENVIANCFGSFVPFKTEENKSNNLLFSLKQTPYNKEKELNIKIVKKYTVDNSEELKIEHCIIELEDGKRGHYLRLAYRYCDYCCSIIANEDFSAAEFSMYSDTTHHLFAISNMVMILYAFSSSKYKTLMFHSSVVCYNGKAYMFLGKSGTGKSTHSKLWLQNIAQTSLLNDDNPIVRINDLNQAIVYGSPWSGKTPCYKNEFAPVGAIVRLSQAPHNKIKQLQGVLSYAAVTTSISSLKWYPPIASDIHNTINILIQNTNIYALECLPDNQAAILCCNTIAK